MAGGCRWVRASVGTLADKGASRAGASIATTDTVKCVGADHATMAVAQQSSMQSQGDGVSGDAGAGASGGA